MAYARLGVSYSNLGERRQAVEHLRAAYELRDRASELERLYLTAHYYSSVTSEIEKGIEIYELWRRTYPRDFTAPNNLAVAYLQTGEFEKAIAESQEAIRLAPDGAFPYANLGEAYLRLDRLDEAKAVIEQALAKGVDTRGFHRMLFAMAHFRGDEAGKQRARDAVKGKPQEIAILDWTGAELALAGRWREAKNVGRRAVESLQRIGFGAVAAEIRANIVVGDAAFGLCGSAPEDVASLLRIQPADSVRLDVIPALVLCGGLPRAQSLIDEIARANPTDTILNRVHLPRSRAIIELDRGNPHKAIELLEAGVPFEAAYPANNYVRGLACLHLREAEKAAAEFRQILDHRGRVGMDLIYCLAQLDFARAKALAGDAAAARTAYQDFLTAWKDADADLPILKKAQAEYAKLQ